MAHSSWGSGWPNCQTGSVVTVTTKSGVRLPVRKELSVLVAGLVADLERARNRKFRADWCWGFACRAISGTNTPSNHSWGLAVDLDAPENPYMSAADHRAPHPLRKTFEGEIVLRSTMPKNAADIARKWGFRWGGLYISKPDPMHFEFTGSVTDAKRLTEKFVMVDAFCLRATKGKEREIVSPYFSHRDELYRWATEEGTLRLKLRRRLNEGDNLRCVARHVVKAKVR